jgi:hypothetical protein
MERLRKFLHLTSSDRRLLVCTALLLGVIRLGLRLLPFRIMQRLVQLVQVSATPHRINQSLIDRQMWAVMVASWYVPKATCLTQALAAQVLLGRHGYPTQLRVGVARGEGGRLEAHAWVENQGKVIVGGEDLSRYTLLQV